MRAAVAAAAGGWKAVPAMAGAIAASTTATLEASWRQTVCCAANSAGASSSIAQMPCSTSGSTLPSPLASKASWLMRVCAAASPASGDSSNPMVTGDSCRRWLAGGS